MIKQLDIIIQSLDRLERKLVSSKSPWLTVGQASDYLKISERHLRRLISQKNLKTYRIPNGKDTGGVRLHKTDLDSKLVFSKSLEKLTRPQRQHMKMLKLED
jgi:excisionase family DNA binding protein